MGFLVVGDLHFTLHPPVARTETFNKDVEAKFDFIRHLSRTRGDVDFLVLMGDLFHRKGSRVTYTEYQALVKQLRSIPVDIWAIVGNHDCPSGKTAGTPFGCLVESNVINLLNADTLPIGRGWHPHCDSDVSYWRPPTLETEYDLEYPILITHGSLSRNPMWFVDNKPGHCLFSDVAELYKDAGTFLIFNGHIHHPDTFKSGNLTIVNTGSYVRTARDQTHQPLVFHVSNTLNVQPIESPLHKPPSRAFKPAPAKTEVFDTSQISEAIAAFEAVDIGKSSLEEVFRQLAEKFPDDVVKRAKEYLWCSDS